MQTRTANVRRDGFEAPPESWPPNPEPDPIGGAVNDNARTPSLASGLVLFAILVLVNVTLFDLHPQSCSAALHRASPSIGDIVKLAGC